MRNNNIDLYGWFLVEAQLGRRSGRGRTCLRGQRHSCADEVFEIFVPVLPNGRIHELIRLPDDVSGLTWRGSVAKQAQQPQVHIRRVGWFERTWRMANRVFNTFKRLSRQQRVGIGLSLWKVIFDLAGAYRIASQFRWGSTYVQWIECCDRLDDKDAQLIRKHIASFIHPPHFHLLLMVDGVEQEAAQATLDSLKRQLFRNFTCAVLKVSESGEHVFDLEAGMSADDSPGAGRALARHVGLKPDLQNNAVSAIGQSVMNDVGRDASRVAQHHAAAWLEQFNATLANHPAGEWVMLLRPGDVLPAHSLYWFACESLARPKAAVLYSDDDMLDEEGLRCQPRFKPDWSLEHFRSTNFVGDAVALRGSEVVAAGGVSLDCCRHGSYDLLLRVIDVVGDEGENSVAHIPAVLLHRMANPLPRPLPQAGEGDKGALRAHLARNRVMGEVSETLPECWRVRYQLSDVPPLVSIIVPTRDQLDLTRQCVESLLAKTTYPRFEILVVDNQSSNHEALAYLAQIAGRDKIKVLRYDQSFNYSAINNFAVREARGEVLCLLNNDTEVISSDWLEEMVGHLLQPKVGVVGAKLYFPDGRVQHAGDTVGPGGCANHLHSFIARDDPGYCNRAVVAQELSAVTGACMIVWKSLYEKLRGLDEKHLPVSFNDVDFCLRVREAGYRVVWTPHAELYHHESVSRGKDQSPEKIRRAQREVAYMRKRWKRVMQYDPFYNQNLSYERTDFSLSNALMVRRPWQR